MYTDLELLVERIAYEAACAEDGHGSWTEAEWADALARLDDATASASPDERARLDFDFLIATQLRHGRLGRVIVRVWVRSFTARRGAVPAQVSVAHRPGVDAVPRLTQLAHSIERTGPPAGVPPTMLEGSVAA